MGKVVLGTVMSLDGYINDQHGSVGQLYPDFSELHKTEMLQESIRVTGAVVMGRHAYEMANGDFTGYEYQVPIFVVTHQPPETAVKGENGAFKFTYVTDGVESAVRQAKVAAGDREVTIVGGANLAQQVLKAGLADELDVGIAPILFGNGLRFFEHLNAAQIKLETAKVSETLGTTYIRFRIVSIED